jgi:hypothetical protein
MGEDRFPEVLLKLVVGWTLVVTTTAFFEDDHDDDDEDDDHAHDHDADVAETVGLLRIAVRGQGAGGDDAGGLAAPGLREPTPGPRWRTPCTQAPRLPGIGCVHSHKMDFLDWNLEASLCTF